jgi:hypothetical protein
MQRNARLLRVDGRSEFFFFISFVLLLTFLVQLQCSKDPEDRLILAERTMDKYLLSGSPKEINLSHEVRVPLEALAAKLKRQLLSDFPASTFQPVFIEVDQRGTKQKLI